MADFDLGAASSVTVHPSAKTKNRKLQVIPLRRETAQMLAEHSRGRLPAAKAFDLPARWETADMLRVDLTTARAGWIAEGKTPEDRADRANSDFLADVDAEGRRLDFHALRTTCGTWLDQAGVEASTATKITGHSSERILRRHYHRSTQRQMREAIEALPDAQLRATGTDDPQQIRQQLGRESARVNATPCDDRPVHDPNGDQRKSLSSTELSGKVRRGAKGCVSEGDGNRTRNLRIDSPVL